MDFQHEFEKSKKKNIFKDFSNIHHDFLKTGKSCFVLFCLVLLYMIQPGVNTMSSRVTIDCS